MVPTMSLLVFPDYFADHMGDYEDVLASLETLNLSILKAMDYTKRVSPPSCALRSAGLERTVQVLTEHPKVFILFSRVVSSCRCVCVVSGSSQRRDDNGFIFLCVC